MKRLTKLLTIIFVALLCYQTNAQTIGIKGGLNLATLNEKDNDGTYSDNYDMNPGFHFGLTVDVPLNEFLSFEPGLLLTTKGMKYEDELIGLNLSGHANLYYIDVPLNLKATHEFGSGVKLYGTIGPYVGMGLSGKIKATLEFQGDEQTEEEEIKWGSNQDEDTFKRLDMGLTFGAGVEINSILLGLSYDLGLSNISTNQDNGMSVKNRVLKFSVGYRFLSKN
ncbi:outer membrane beta-barrel protein [Flammeovirga yaeyamensis]|uniref:Outer membrane beta-barrel protein n=1 Tax=Flammeovirga yaeyamensis TaxID=367791 RepID=A0AAX1NCF3_9BACT|nr:porin family protein [Flammeovirga yaeyamensis]MBB3699515.1 opacity protein-like surface antigen [Flammeovirga yaeyamensis]NMF35229.1 PorT family protein [Flammeovirga yaeyamensis]QWG04091.1 outer membrane beta-barrel protein [Flammeovirga yaeyamensis]